ncbi:DUF4190 domain-containing protein [Micromonospora profundi]|uniref:DUF4190 domain-containing protein n=1 Tax=Micromonospora profundi TaxID=1420889 RepID=A0AAJ6HLT2_9ACTN|nr:MULTISPECIES: DUF4190 domain-containing protein [Micromonospora]KOX13459.1 hypothetical protein ADK66_04510 [Micromonospora sp. NRRL B-16802]NJC11358.1 uncharacterized protein HemX [Micromonospora profundi]WLS43175.1 DUF4190 domain-containing protein [Micromonospora profundi]
MTAASEPARGAGEPAGSRTHRASVNAKTSAAATFALVFGVAGLLSVLTAILAWIGLILGIIGVILGIFGLKMSRRPGVTGRGVAIGGLVLSILAVLIGLGLAAGITTFVNNDSAVDRLQQQVDDLRDKLD